ncbi:MAG: hypothetical protein GXP32_03860 [Kiritimatiellaeota bacterium]|nr:hypothetical protein [Kiritimatiellota bacterium]
MSRSYENIGVEFYSHSGRFSPLFILIFPIAFITSILLAFVYNALVIYIPIIGYFSVVLTFGYALIIGVVTGLCLSLFKVRNMVIARLAGLVCGVLALYLAWVVFVYLFLGEFSPKTEITLIGAVFNPIGIWNVACAIAEKGWYSIRTLTPSGWVLWTFWIIEALIIQITIFFSLEASIGDSVFCEECGEWAEDEEGVVNFLLNEDENLTNDFLRKDFSFLKNAVR